MSGRKASLLLLISVGVFGVLAEIRRTFTHVPKELNWTQAVAQCLELDSVLASLLDASENVAATPLKSEGKAWTGLSRTWTWALEGDSEPLDSSWVLHWADDQPQDKKNCTTLRTSDQKWVSQYCNTKLRYASCYSEVDQMHHIVEGFMDWGEAQDLCRTSFTDLSSARNQSHIREILRAFEDQSTTTTTARMSTSKTTTITTSTTTTTTTSRTTTTTTSETTTPTSETTTPTSETTTPTSETTTPTSETTTPTSTTTPEFIWIGLSWRWVWWDNSPVSWNGWNSNPDEANKGCMVLKDDGTWDQEECDHLNPFICQKDEEQMKQTKVKLRLNPGSADLTDPVVKQSLLKQINQRLQSSGVTGVKLSWGQCKKEPTKTVTSAPCELKV